jgi:CRP-like cAMP-binding protein
VILSAGAASDELMLILQGCASIVVDRPEGQPVRLAGVRRGAVIGEVGFLDGSPRSASVIAQEDVVATLDRSSYDGLAQSHPALLPKLVANIAVGLAARLRHTNPVALARARGH